MSILQNRLILIRKRFQSSPYHLPMKETSEPLSGSVPDIERYQDLGKAGVHNHEQTSKKQPLHEVVVMDPKYLPAELYSAKQQKASLQARKAAGAKRTRKQEGIFTARKCKATYLIHNVCTRNSSYAKFGTEIVNVQCM
jgi:hypothetical protein